MIGCGLLLLFEPEDSLLFVSIVLGLALVVYGAHKLWYFGTMARHMAGGLSILFIGVIALDIGGFSIAVIGDPRLSIVLYLVCHNMYTGVLAIARGVEAKLFGSPWKLSVVHGVVNILLVVLCIAFVGSDQTLIAVFCLGLFYNAFVRLYNTFRRTEIIYIQ